MEELLEQIIVRDEGHDFIDEVWLELSHPECKAIAVSIRVKRDLDERLEDHPVVTCNEIWEVTSHKETVIVSALFLKAASIIEKDLQKYRDSADAFHRQLHG